MVNRIQDYKMKKQYHVLNGDALFEQFPKSIEGSLIIIRECLVEGNVMGADLKEFFNSRAQFLSEKYSGSLQDYYDKVASEFEKIIAIEEDCDINLWFEDDLFCQVNFWFVVSLLNQGSSNKNVFLVRPMEHSPYGFGGLSASELTSIYEKRIHLNDLQSFEDLWKSFKMNELNQLLAKAKMLSTKFPFILDAAGAHRDRNLSNEINGRPVQALLEIMNELDTEEFGLVFQEFCKRESIYGFGDAQVKTLYDIAINNR